MITSQNGKNLTKCFEHLFLKVYLDSGGVKTVGWGNISHAKTMNVGDKITLAQAEQYLAEDLKEAEDAVNKFMSTFGLLNQAQFDVLVDAVFNCGESFLEWWNNPDPLRKGIGTFARCISDNQIVLDGLLKRRCVESYIFQCGYTPKILTWIEKNGK